MSRVYTAASPIHGTGVFSSVQVSPGEVVLKIDDSRVVTDAEPLDPAKGECEHHCDYLAGGKVVLMQAPERFINHSCNPNTYVRTIAGDRCVIALRAIRPGEEITYDYSINGDVIPYGLAPVAAWPAASGTCPASSTCRWRCRPAPWPCSTTGSSPSTRMGWRS
jgi:hypothetical protein